MKLQALLEGIPVSALHAPAELEISGVSYDSRTTRPGDLFVAIPGYAADGHRFIPMALERGAAAVLCEHSMPEAAPWVQVPSARTALARLGANWYGHPADTMQMIGVTGTNGKTSVTCLVKEMLEACCGAKVGLIGTIRNMIGSEELETERTTPESFALQGLLARMRDAGCTHVVMEVSSHALALHRVEGIRFQVGAFTNLTEDHLDFHKTMEEYRKAKAKLFRACEQGVFNADAPAAEQMIAEATCGVHTVGTKNAMLCGEEIELASDHISMLVREGEETAQVRVGIPGRFTVSNALVALGIVRQLGIPLRKAAEALGTAKGVRGRVEVVPTPGKLYTVLIDYAHTPDGLENLLRSVKDFCRGRIILVFGCGGDRDKAKRPIMGAIAADNADMVIVTSDNPRTEDPNEIIREIVEGTKGRRTPVKVLCDRVEAIHWAIDNAGPGDVILLAGKGHEDYQVVGHEKRHMDEREIVAEYLAAKRR